jgi:hypothetical protein
MPERLVAFGALGERVHDDRESGGQHQGRAKPLGSAHRDQERCPIGERACQRRRGEQAKSEHQDPATAQQVGRRPPSSRKPPKVSAYPVATHCKLVSLNCRSGPIVGSDTLTIVRSIVVMKYDTPSNANVNQRLMCLVGNSSLHSSRLIRSGSQGVAGRQN